jgi:hypothetical protein
VRLLLNLAICVMKPKSDPASMADKLGLPPGMQVNSCDVYQHARPWRRTSR